MFYHLICCSEVNEYFLKIKDVCVVREPIWYEIYSFNADISLLYHFKRLISDKLENMPFLGHR